MAPGPYWQARWGHSSLVTSEFVEQTLAEFTSSPPQRRATVTGSSPGPSGHDSEAGGIMVARAGSDKHPRASAGNLN
jgi:hypothetical protein